jgi:hypothetical protein
LQRFRALLRPQRRALLHREDPQIIDPVDVVRVFMGIEHRIHVGAPRGDQLEPQLGRGVDEQGDAINIHQRPGAGAAVARIGRETDRAGAADLRYPE